MATAPFETKPNDPAPDAAATQPASNGPASGGDQNDDPWGIGNPTPNAETTAASQSEEPSPQQKMSALVDAIQALNKNNPEHFTKDGRPNARYLTQQLGFAVSIEMRDEVWNAMSPPQARDPVAAAPAGPVPGGINPAPMPGMPYVPGKWMVIDTHAKHMPRRHIVRADHPGYDLSATRGTMMPIADAAKFLNDSAFEVYNEDGQRVSSLPSMEDFTTGKDQSIVLQEDETVAKVGELTTRALVLRCNRYPGGEKFTEDSARPVMEDFYIEQRRRIRAGTQDRGTNDAMTADLDDAAVSQMLERQAQQQRSAGLI